MKRTPALIGSLLLLASYGPAAEPAPTFAVASVKLSPDGGGTGKISPGRAGVEMHRVSLAACILWACSIESYQLRTPQWTTEQLVDISARSGHEATPDELKRMMQSLLSDRFHLAMREQTESMSAYALVLGKSGHRMRPSSADGEEEFQSDGHFDTVMKRVSMPRLAAVLSHVVDRPVLDETGLEGSFDFVLKLTAYVPKDGAGEAASGAEHDIPYMFATAVQDQLGLKLESRRAVVRVLVVERIERVPSAN